MKFRKIIYLGVFMLFASLVLFMTNESKAAELTSPVYFGIQEYRTNSDPQNMAYGINNPNKNDSTPETIKGAKIWDIVKYNSASGGVYDNSVDYYCVRAGVGFRNTGDIATYDFSCSFNTERDVLLSSNNKYLKSIAADEAYYKILALVDLLYIPGESTDEEKTELLNASLVAAGIDIDEFAVGLTNSDIEAVQQAAVWYFTNYDDELYATVYNQKGLENEDWFTYNFNGMEDYTSLRDYPKGVDDPDAVSQEGEQRLRQAVALYNYLIDTAVEREQGYKDGTTKSRK